MLRPQLKQISSRPRLACEITAGYVIAGRASDRSRRLDVVSSRRLNEGALAPSMTNPNVLDSTALRNAISGALTALGGSSRDVIAIVPDASVRVVLLDFETLPPKAQDVEPMIRFRLKKSLPFDVDHAALSYDVRSRNGAIQVVAAVSPGETIAEYEAAFRDVGYAPGFVLPSTIAALSMVEADRPTLLLKVDSAHITLAAADRHELRLIRTLDNPHGALIAGSDLAEALLPSVVFFEDTFGEPIERILVGGIGSVEDLSPLLREHTGARVEELAPDLSSSQNISGESLPPSLVAGVAGALVG